MTIKITWCGHSTVLLEMDGVRILTDPALRRRVGPLRRVGPPPSPDVWRHPDAVLLSHLHHDHADLRSLRMLGSGRRILTSRRNAAWLTARGLEGVGMDEGAWLDVGPVAVSLVRADHHSRPMPHRPNDAHGHLVRGESGVVWVAGDTSLYEEMSRIPSTAGAPIDLAVVPIWGWGPRLSQGHLDPWDAARACALVHARYAVPVHWGTLHVPGLSNSPRGWMAQPGAVFVEALRELARECKPVVLSPGSSQLMPSVPAAASDGGALGRHGGRGRGRTEPLSFDEGDAQCGGIADAE